MVWVLFRIRSKQQLFRAIYRKSTFAYWGDSAPNQKIHRSSIHVSLPRTKDYHSMKATDEINLIFVILHIIYHTWLASEQRSDSLLPKFFLPQHLKRGRIKKIKALFNIEYPIISIIKCHYFFDLTINQELGQKFAKCFWSYQSIDLTQDVLLFQFSIFLFCFQCMCA